MADTPLPKGITKRALREMSPEQHSILARWSMGSPATEEEAQNIIQFLKGLKAEAPGSRDVFNDRRLQNSMRKLKGQE